MPGDTVVGRWWRDETAEIDVLALSGTRPVLVGESRWQARELTERDLAEVRRKTAYLPQQADLSQVVHAFWSRGAASDALARHPDVRTFTPSGLLPG